jgi:hypothetical protein
VLAFLKSYFPKAPVDVVVGGITVNCSDEQFGALMEVIAPIAEHVDQKWNLQ